MRILDAGFDLGILGRHSRRANQYNRLTPLAAAAGDTGGLPKSARQLFVVFLSGDSALDHL